MSDFSGFEQSFALASMTPNGVEAPPSRRSAIPGLFQRSYDVPLEEIAFRRVRAGDEVAAVQKLRAEIQLPGAAVADPGFVAREKKEIGAESSVRSNGGTISSAP
jgi:hypothetical protein